VPFDTERGFDPEAVLRDAPEWAIRHGLAPVHFPSLANQLSGLDPTGRRIAAEQLAPLYAALGLYERAIRLDRQLVAWVPADVAPHRRLLWSLLHLGRTAEALELAAALPAPVSSDPIARGLADAAHRVAEAEARSDPDEAARIVASLPVLTPRQAAQLLASLAGPPARGDAPSRALARGSPGPRRD
jgi:tetratricopeptide (TPR) repeat protein